MYIYIYVHIEGALANKNSGIKQYKPITYTKRHQAQSISAQQQKLGSGAGSNRLAHNNR